MIIIFYTTPMRWRSNRAMSYMKSRTPRGSEKIRKNIDGAGLYGLVSNFEGVLEKIAVLPTQKTHDLYSFFEIYCNGQVPLEISAIALLKNKFKFIQTFHLACKTIVSYYIFSNGMRNRTIYETLRKSKRPSQWQKLEGERTQINNTEKNFCFLLGTKKGLLSL